MDRIYRIAQEAHDNIFLAELTNRDSKKRCNKFKKNYQNGISPLVVNLNGLNSLLRILLVRNILLTLVDTAKYSQNLTVHYKFGRKLYKCNHIITKGYSVVFQPGNFVLQGVGSYYTGTPSIKSKLRRAAKRSSYSSIASKIRISRTTGTPIRRFGNLLQSDVDFLNCFVLLQDFEVMRRLYRERDEYGELTMDPTNSYDHLPVGVAIAAVSYLMSRRDSKYSFNKINFFGVFAEKEPWDRNKVPEYKDWVELAAEKRSQVIRELMKKLGPFRFTVNAIKKIILKEFGTQN